MTRMRHILVATIVATLLALPAHAACKAEYKAKKDRPLQFDYGVIQLPDQACGNPRAAEQMVRSQLAARGWKLLVIVSLTRG